MHIVAEKILGFVLPKIFTPLKPERLTINNERFADIPDSLKVTSPDFADAGVMPWVYGGEGVGEDTSPPIDLDNVPENAGYIIFVLEDLDVPLPFPVCHTSAINISPDTTHFAKGYFDKDAGKATFGKGFGGANGYIGPRPIVGHGPHRYYFQFFVVSKDANPLESASKLEVVVDTIAKYGISKGSMYGTFERTNDKYKM